MGFQWNSSRSTTSFLSTSIFGTDPTALDSNNEQTGWTFTYGQGSIGNPVGPNFYIDSFGGALQYIKLGIVYSIFDEFFKPKQDATTLFPNIYNIITGKSISALPYSSSYVLEKVILFNILNPIIQGDAAKTTGTTTTWNQHYMRLPDARYVIYGLKGFTFPKSTTNNTCISTISINSILNSINSYTVNTLNTDPTNIYFSADIFTYNVGRLCTPTTTNVSPFLFLNNLGKKKFFTVPIQIEQFIQEWPVTSIGINGNTNANPNEPNFQTPGVPTDNVNYAGVSLMQQKDPANPTTNYFKAAQKAIYLQYYGSVNGNNDTILFRAELPFLGLTAGAPLSIEFGFFDGPKPIGYTGPKIGMIDDAKYSFQVSVNEFVVYQTIYTAGPLVDAFGNPSASSKTIYNDGISAFNRVNQIFKGININSNTANVVITVSYTRSRTNDQNVFTYIVLSQYLQAYDPNTGCCVSSCPANTGLDIAILPPTCVYCNTQAGLFYNPNNGTCTCLSGFYLDSTKSFQCYACTALYCSICNPLNPDQCYTCATGVVLNNVTFTCNCQTRSLCTCLPNFTWNPKTLTCTCNISKSILVDGKCILCSSIPQSTGAVQNSTACRCIAPLIWLNFACVCNHLTQITLDNGKCFTCPNNANNGTASANSNNTCRCLPNYIWVPSTTGGLCSCDQTTSYIFKSKCLSCSSDVFSTGFGAGNGSCLCKTDYYWSSTSTKANCLPCQAFPNFIKLTNQTCYICGANNTFSTTKKPSKLNNSCNCNISILKWDENGYCDCGVGSVLIASGNTYICFTCNNATAFTKSKVDSYTCSCVSTVLQWNSLSRSCVCPYGAIIVGKDSSAQCFICPRSALVLGPSANQTICICIGNLSWISSSKSCGCLNGQVIIGSEGRTRCISCLNVLYGKVVSGSQSCGCIGIGMTFNSQDGICSCSPNSIILPSFTCVLCPDGATPLTPYQCRCPINSFWSYSLQTCRKCGDQSTNSQIEPIPYSLSQGGTNFACVCQPGYIWDVMTQQCISSNSCRTPTPSCMSCSSGAAVSLVVRNTKRLTGGQIVELSLNGPFTNYNRIRIYQCQCSTGMVWEPLRLGCFAVGLV